MITRHGYSSDPNIVPEGVILTLPVAWFHDRKMTQAEFHPYFERVMADEETTWNFKLTNLPKQDVLWVYLLFYGQIHYRCNFVQYERSKAKTFVDDQDGIVRNFESTNWVIMSGPPVKPRHEIVMKGFQGFRYCTELF